MAQEHSDQAAPTALITGVLGQDGSLLATELSAVGHRVVGVARPGSVRRPGSIPPGVEVVEADLCDDAAVETLLDQWHPQQIYHLAAFHHSSQEPAVSAVEAKQAMLRHNFLSTQTLALALLRRENEARLVFASSSQIFSGDTGVRRVDEDSHRNPQTLYGHCKSWSMDLLAFLQRESGLHFSSAILFNHESPRRPQVFVTRKISTAAARAARGLPVDLQLLNIGARVDWSSAHDVVRALRLMADADAPADYVVASGVLHSVRAVLDVAFGHVGLEWQRYTQYEEDRDAPALVGDTQRLCQTLGWQPEVSFQEMIVAMVEHDLALAKA